MQELYNKKIKDIRNNLQNIQLNMQDIVNNGFNFEDVYSILGLEYNNKVYTHEYNSCAVHYVFCGELINFGSNPNKYNDTYIDFGKLNIENDLIDILKFNRINNYFKEGVNKCKNYTHY